MTSPARKCFDVVVKQAGNPPRLGVPCPWRRSSRAALGWVGESSSTRPSNRRRIPEAGGVGGADAWWRGRPPRQGGSPVEMADRYVEKSGCRRRAAASRSWRGDLSHGEPWVLVFDPRRPSSARSANPTAPAYRSRSGVAIATDMPGIVPSVATASMISRARLARLAEQMSRG